MRTVGYTRVSSQDQADNGISLDNQRAKIQAYCDLKDLDLIEIIEDAGVSAKNLKRPGVKKVLEMAHKKKVKAVVVYKLDRMFRSTLDALETTKQFDKKGVAFHSITESIDTRSAMGKFFFTLLSSVAELERNVVGERTKAALQYKKSLGEKTGGNVPYGKDVTDTGHLVTNQTEQKVITTVLRFRKRGMNYSKIARKLNKGGYPTKTGKQWHAQQVKNVVIYYKGGVNAKDESSKEG